MHINTADTVRELNEDGTTNTVNINSNTNPTLPSYICIRSIVFCGFSRLNSTFCSTRRYTDVIPKYNINEDIRNKMVYASGLTTSRLG